MVFRQQKAHQKHQCSFPTPYRPGQQNAFSEVDIKSICIFHIVVEIHQQAKYDLVILWMNLKMLPVSQLSDFIEEGNALVKLNDAAQYTKAIQIKMIKFT